LIDIGVDRKIKNENGYFAEELTNIEEEEEEEEIIKKIKKSEKNKKIKNKNINNEFTLDLLPGEILTNIFRYCYYRELFRVGLVCKIMYQISNDSYLWKQMYESVFPNLYKNEKF